MNRNEWIENFDESMHVKFNMAIDFFNRYGNRYPNTRGKVREKYRKSDGTHVPTEGEYNLLVNSKQFQRHYAYMTSEPKYEVGDLVFTKVVTFPELDKVPCIGVVVTRDYSTTVGWTYNIQIMKKTAIWPDVDTVNYIQQKNILPIAGRNLNKVK